MEPGQWELGGVGAQQARPSPLKSGLLEQEGGDSSNPPLGV